MGQQHPRRIWDEVMSNAMAVFIRSVVRRESSLSADAGTVRASPAAVLVEEDSEDEMPVRDGRRRMEQRVVREASPEASEEASQEASQEAGGCNDNRDGRWQLEAFLQKLQAWDGVCLVCKAMTGFEARGHQVANCPRGAFAQGMVVKGLEQMSRMAAPVCEQGRCWVGWQRCNIEWETGICRWSQLAGSVTITILYAGSGATEAQAWVARDKQFGEEMERGRDGSEALRRFFRRATDWNGVESNLLCELIWQYG